MGRQDCRKEYFETGNWFQVKSVRDIAMIKEANGQDASFERYLLKKWSRLDGWRVAGKAF